MSSCGFSKVRKQNHLLDKQEKHFSLSYTQKSLIASSLSVTALLLFLMQPYTQGWLCWHCSNTVAFCFSFKLGTGKASLSKKSLVAVWSLKVGSAAKTSHLELFQPPLHHAGLSTTPPDIFTALWWAHWKLQITSRQQKVYVFQGNQFPAALQGVSRRHKPAKREGGDLLFPQQQ